MSSTVGADRMRLTIGDSLSYAQLRHVLQILRSGGLCIVPSDTCYAVAGIPNRRDVLPRIVKVLPDKQTEAIPLSFGSLAMAQEWVLFTAQDQRAIEKYFPGPLTLVCEMNPAVNRDALSNLLHTSGTIGVRISDSAVERQISTELGSPITTCAIRDDHGEPVRGFDDAIDIIRKRLSNVADDITLAAIEMPTIEYPVQSTVVTVQPRLAFPNSVRVYRPGAIEPERIEDAIHRPSLWDVEDWS